MKFIVALLLVASGLTAEAHAAARASAVAKMDVTPLQKVIQLLDGMLSKGKKEKHEEEVEFAKFAEWCDNTRFTTTKSIDEAASQIEQLTADIAKAGADAETLASEIADLEASIAQAEGEKDSATALRKKENADYMAQRTDFSESIDAIERAVSVLKSREADVPQSLLQVQNSPKIPAQAKAAIESFLALSQEPGDGVPEANAYEFQSGGVVSLLEKLRLKFQDQKLALEKAEMNAKANYEMLLQKLLDNIKEDKAQASKKTAAKAGRLEDKASAEGELKITEAGKAEDEKTLSDTNAKCKMMSEEFENNQVVRAGEVKAIKKAMEILSSDAVTGNAGKYLPKLAQTGATTALVQLRGVESPAAAEARKALVAFLQSRAKKSGSKYLALVASHAESDPFAKVKKMIKDLIVKLMEQTNAEADHKAYCDTELATNKQTREIKQSEVDELSASIEKHTAEATELGEEIAELTEALSDLARQQAEATKIRGEEKAINEQTVADAKEAQLAVEKATQVLKEFYAQAAEASLLQNGGEANLAQQMAAASKAPYKGMQSESGGIAGFLEVVLSDFARLESETSAAEDAAQTTYQSFMDESNESIAVKETEKEHKENKKQNTEATIATEKKELELTQSELDAALEYYEKLKPDCVDHNLSYDDRVKMREEEIQSLKEALQVLAQEDIA